MPFYSKLYLDAFFRTCYRLLISHNNLLHWVTAEDAAKTQDKTFSGYLKHFTFHLVFSFILLIVGLLFLSLIHIYPQKPAFLYPFHDDGFDNGLSCPSSSQKEGFPAVSYTHLDVYKRQASNIRIFFIYLKIVKWLIKLFIIQTV